MTSFLDLMVLPPMVMLSLVYLSANVVFVVAVQGIVLDVYFNLFQFDKL